MSDETSPKPKVATSPNVKPDEPTEAIQNGNGSFAPAVDKEEANAGN
jgi:hypothetical protein